MVEKRQDKYFIVNDGTLPLNYEVTKLFDCVDYFTIADGTVAVGEEYELSFTEDAEYQVILTEEGSTESITFTIVYYLNLQLSLIESLYEVLCDCKCGCENCTGDSDKALCNLLMTKAKMDVYKRLTNPMGVSFYNAIYRHTKCLVKKPIYCAVTQETIIGEADCNQELIKQMLALDYLAMYYFELAQQCLNCDKQFIRNKFIIEKIFCCIKDLGIDIEDIEELINGQMGVLTINSGAYVNQPPSAVGNNTIAVDNRAMTVLTLAMFTVDTTPAYADPENDPVADVRIDTLPADGQLLLNGTPVTAGQVIPIADINANLLVFNSPNQDPLDSDAINFSLRDTGSGQFSS